MTPPPRITVVLLALATVSACLATSAYLAVAEPAKAAFPGLNAQIAFMSDRDGVCLPPTCNFNVYAMNPDGSEPRRLTDNPAEDRDPAWSAGGERIAFFSTRDGNREIYAMNADGSGQTRLTTNTASDLEPAWSPDGTKLAFRTNRGGSEDVYVMNADGTGQQALADNPAFDGAPAWSPDGSKIAFYSTRDGNAEVYVMNADGSGQARLTTNPSDEGHPAWSPDGSKIAFFSTRDGNLEIYVMNADGSGQVRLTNNPAVDFFPAWSPDGAQIAFESRRSGTAEVWVMNANGANPTQLTFAASGLGNNGQPDWQPLVNHAPVADAGGPYSAPEGAAFTVDASGSSDPDDGIALYEWDLDGDGQYDDATGVAASATYGDNGSFTVAVKVTDRSGASSTDAAAVLVTNVPPTASFSNDGPVSEGSIFHLSLSDAHDPSPADTAAGFGYAFDCGDGSGYRAPSAANTAECQAIDDPEQAVSGRILDKDGAFTEYASLISVMNVPPTLGAIAAPEVPVAIGTAIDANASFSDPGAADVHTAVWEWGDATTSAGTTSEAGGSGSVTGSHTYTVPGIYTIGVTVDDGDGGFASSQFQYVVVYDPVGGYVIGRGFIESPAGAYAADPTLVGPAQFALVSKYKKGATTPTGRTAFVFELATLDFRSDNYEWLVVSGARAQYKGTGTINGAGPYGFILTAIDGQLAGGGGADKFRIKIWDKASGAVVYDNQLGATDDALATTVITSGRITIHK